ncbi:uncharacterized protein LOC101857753 [Aplysia californica]|uniref:Uncharacterized protein LOC101857753 n=1 Tax=Aplysia californica TaxID=6500 RepID=A0ABM0K7R4_APLCA|nr:uncharacterized protein LOC101857753 [Aplysia californica]
MRSTPWFHQRRSESAPPVERPREPPSISAKEQDEVTERLLRPTESALYRQSLYWKLDSFMDRGFHSWSKMDLFSDCKRCMWTPDGSIKRSCKIRPLRTSQVALPPLSGRSQHHHNVLSTESNGSETTRSSLQTPSTPASHRHSRARHRPSRGHVTWRIGLPPNGTNGIRGQQTRCSLPLPPKPSSRPATHYSIGV